jgi:hypothetical protein
MILLVMVFECQIPEKSAADGTDPAEQSADEYN